MGICRKINRLKGLVCAAIACATLILPGAAVHAACAPGKVSIKTPSGTHSFDVRLAISPEERAQGLMFVESMPADEGMLFVFESERALGFWMKNTLIPLDMIFITSRGTIRRVHSNAIPHDLSTIRSGGPAIAVLEVNGGVSRRLGISKGALVQHPALPQTTSAWPCS